MEMIRTSRSRRQTAFFPPTVLLATWLLLATSTAAEGDWPKAAGLEIGIHLEVERHPALSRAFVDRIDARVRRMLRTLLGSNVQLKTLVSGKLADWLQGNALARLTPDLCRKLGCGQMEKALLLSVGYRQGTYTLVAGEYDRHFDHFGPAQTAEVLQRSMVPDMLGRLAMRCWTPVGRVEGPAGDDTYRIRFPNQNSLVQMLDWSRLRRGAVLQLYREVQLPEGIQQVEHTGGQFLLIRDTMAQEITARLAVAPDDSRWFKYLGHPRARYLVRRVDPQPGMVTVQAIMDEQPREDCEVYASKQLPSIVQGRLGQKQGLTDANGRLTFQVNQRGLVYVSVVYSDLTVTKACVPGISQGTLKFVVPDRRLQTDFAGQLNQVNDRIRDAAATVNVLVKRIEQAAKNQDAALAKKLAQQARTTVDLTALRRKVESIQRNAANKGYDVGGRATPLLADINRMDKQLQAALASFHAAANAVTIAELQEDIRESWVDADWYRVHKLFQQYMSRRPNDKIAKDKSDYVNKHIASKGADHQAARDRVVRTANAATVDEVLNQWAKTRQAVETLVKYQDPLFLVNAKHALARCSTLISTEVGHITKKLQDGNVSAMARQQLQARAKELQRVNQELPQLEKRVDEILQPAE